MHNFTPVRICVWMQLGLEMQWAKCHWSFTFSRARPLKIGTETVQYVPSTQALELLGTWVSLGGKCTADIQNRIAKCWRAFHANRDLLLNRSAPLRVRLRTLERSVLPCLLWCAGTWTVSQHELAQLKTLQLQMYRRIMRAFPQDGESKADYMQRSATRARNCMQSIGAIPWNQAVLNSIFAWAGHVARMEAYDQTRLAVKLLKWRDYNYLVTMRGLQNGRLNRGHLRRPWRWDFHIARYFSPEQSLHEPSQWREKTKLREVWEDYQQSWCMYRLSE